MHSTRTHLTASLGHPPRIRNSETFYFTTCYLIYRCGVAELLKIGDWYCDELLRKQISLLNVYY